MLKRLLVSLLVAVSLQGCQRPVSTDESGETIVMPKGESLVLALKKDSGDEVFRSDLGYPPLFVDEPGFLGDGKFFFPAKVEDQLALRALDARTGKELWIRVLTSASQKSMETGSFFLRNGLPGYIDPKTGLVDGPWKSTSGKPLTFHGKTIFSGGEKQLLALNTEDWKELWRVDFPRATAAATVDDGAVVAVNQDSCLLVNEKGETVWNYQSPTQLSGMTVGDGMVFLATAQPSILALDSKTGQKVWEKTWDGGDNVWARPYFGEGVVVLPAGEKLEAFEASTGTPSWVYDGPGRMAALEESSGHLFVNSTKAQTVTSLNLADGKVNWTKKLELVPVGPPCFNESNLYVNVVKTPSE